MPKSTDISQEMVYNAAYGTYGSTSNQGKYSIQNNPVWFSPLKPLAPVAQDAAHGRQFDYPVGYNTRIRPKDDSAVTYAELRALADNLDVLRLVIETRKDQVESFEWNVVAKKGKNVSEAEIDKIKAKLYNPTDEYDWNSWIRMILEDLFVIDAVSIMPRKTRGGDLYSLDIIDGSTIKRVITEDGRTPMPPDPAYQQILKGVPATNYTTEELIYTVRNPRSHKLYGYSPVEQIIMTINIALRRQLTQLQYYTEGNIPEALVGVPDTWNPDQVRQFQLYFDSIMQGNTATRSRLKFLPLDVNKIHETKDPALKDVFDEWLARVVCYAFSVPPSAFVAQMNRATAETAQDAALQEGLAPILGYIKRLVDRIIIKHFKRNDVEFQWVHKSAIKPLEQANIDKIYIEAGVKDVNEVRLSLGLDEKEVVDVKSDETVSNKQAKESKDDMLDIAEKSLIINSLIKSQSSSSDIDKLAELYKSMIDSQQKTNDALIKIATKEAPIPVVNIDNRQDIKEVTKKVSAKRMPDGTLVATFDNE